MLRARIHGKRVGGHFTMPATKYDVPTHLVADQPPEQVLARLLADYHRTCREDGYSSPIWSWHEVEVTSGTDLLPTGWYLVQCELRRQGDATHHVVTKTVGPSRSRITVVPHDSEPRKRLV